MVMSFARIGAAVLAFAWSLGAMAQATYSTYVDTDNNAATGCTVTLPGGTFAGAEVRIQVAATTGGSPAVTGVTSANCASGTFGAGSSIAGASPIGFDNGTAGSDVIEFSIARAALFGPGGGTARVGFTAENAGGSDVMLTNDGSVGGDPILLAGSPLAIPFIGFGGLLLIAAVLFFFGSRSIRARRALQVSAVGPLLIATAALASNFIVDGQVPDWTGEPVRATDPAGDSTDGAAATDLRAVYFGTENQRIYFRLDVADLQNAPPVIAPVAATTLEDTATTITLSATDPEGGNVTFAIVTPPTRGTLSAITPLTATTASVTYTPNADANGSDTFVFSASDPVGSTAQATANITITPVNDAPQFTVQDPPAVDEDSPTQTATVATGIVAGPPTATDETSQALTLTITNNTNAALFTGTPTITNAGVLTYTPAPGADGTAVLTLQLQDNGGTANGGVDTAPVQTITVTINPVNDPPVLTAGATLAYTENQAATPIDTTITVTDGDSANLASATVQITANYQNGADVLAFTNTGTISGAFNAATGTLTLTGSDTLAAYQAALRSVTYQNTSENPTTTPRTITWIANDGIETSAPVTSTVTVAAANDAPVVTAGGVLAYTENQPATTVDGAVTVTDGDNANLASATVQITTGYVNGEDVLSCTTCAPLTAAFNAATGTLTLTGTATVAQYQAALRNVQYVNASNDPTTGIRTVTWIANDGALASAPASSTITVVAVNDAPVLTAGATLAYTEGQAAAIVDGTVTVTDADDPTLTSATVQVTANYQNGADVLSFVNTGTITGAFNAGTGTLTLTGPDTLANYQAALRSVRYVNTSGNPTSAARTITWIGSDGAAASTPVTSTITIATTNDAPVLTAGGTIPYLENQPAATVDPSVTVTDVDSPNLVSATVQITTNYVPGQDVLTCGTCGAITATFDGPTGTLTLTGSATLAAYQAALRTVAYANASDNPTTGPRTITWIGNDGALASAPVTSTVNLIAVADAPVLGGGGNTVTYTEGDAPLQVNGALTVSDVDSTSLQSATATISTNYQNGQDVLSFTPVGAITGVFNAGTGELQLTGVDTLANYETALRSVRYANTSNAPATPARTVTFRAIDTTGSVSAPVATTVNVVSTNSAPTITAGATAAFTENAAPVVIDNTVVVADVDSANLASATVTIVARPDGAAEVLACGACGGLTAAYNGGTGTLTITGSATVAAYQAALRSVNYENTSDNPTTTNRAIQWVVDDGALSSAPATSTVTITASNDAPVVTAGCSAGYTENGAPVAACPAATVTDADSANLTGATIAITTGFQSGADVLALSPVGSITGSYNPGTGTLTLSGTATVAQYQAALQAVTYANTSEAPTTAPRTLSWTATDGTATSAIATSSVPVTAVPDAPVLTAGATLAYTENNPATAIDTTITVTDVDSANLASATAQITTNYAPGEDVLSCAACGAITASFNAGTGTLTLTGAATLAQYQAALRSVSYVNTSDQPSTLNRTVTWIGNDGALPSAAVTSTITVAAANDAPVATDKTHETHSAIELEITAALHTGELLEGATDPDDPVGELTVGAITGINPPTMVVTVVNAADGSFRVDPPGGFSGTASFQYTVCDDGLPIGPALCSAPVTVTVNVTGPDLWFVDDSAGSSGDGGLNDPFDTMSDLPAGRGTGDRIFVHEGTYTGGHVFQANERLVGAGAAGTFDTVLEVDVPANGALDARPSLGGIRPTLGNTVVFANSADMRGVTVSSGANAGLSASGSTNVTVLDSAVITATANAVSFSSSSTSAAGVNLSETTSGGGASGILLANSPGTYAFGTGSLTGHTNAAFRLTDSGASTITYAGNIVSGGNVRAIAIGTADGNPAANAANGLDNAGASVTLSGSLTGGGVAVYESTGGTLNLTGAQTHTTGTNNAIDLVDNNGATINLQPAAGAIALTTTTGRGFNATDGGTVNVTGANNTISTGAAIALNVIGTAVEQMGGQYNFRTVSSNGGSHGVRANFVNGPVRITGTDGGDADTFADAGTGGTVQNHTNRGVEMVNVTGPVVLGGVNVTSAGENQAAPVTCGDALNGTTTGCGAGIHLQNMTANTTRLETVAVTGSEQIGINVHTVASLTLVNSNVANNGNENGEDGLQAVNLTGTSAITSTTFTGNFHRQAEVQNSTGTLTSLAVTDSTFNRGTYVSTAAQGLLFAGRGTAAMTTTIQRNTFATNFGSGFFGQSMETANLTVNLGDLGNAANGNTFTNNSLAMQLIADNAGALAYTVGNNVHTVTPVVTSGATPFAFRKSLNATGAVTGTVGNNRIGTSGVAQSGNNCAGCNGMTVQNEGAGGVFNLTITGNEIQRVNQRGIEVLGQGNAQTNVVVTNNTIREPEGGAGQALYAESENDPTDLSTLCMDVRNNVVGGTWDTALFPGGRNMRLREGPEFPGAPSRFRLVGLVGTTAPDVVNYLNANNTNAIASATTSNGFTGGAAPCF